MPDDWKIGNLEDVIKFYNGYAFKSKELLNKQKKSCYAVFKQGHIKSGGGFIPTGTKSWFPKKKSENLQKYILCKGDILMAMTDMKDNVAILGNTAVMAVDNQYLLNQRVGLLRCNGKYEISYPYIYLLTNSKDFLQDLRSRANSGVQVNLSSAAIKESSIIIPSRSTNIKFNQIVKPMFEITFKNNMEIDRLTSLRDTLLPKLISGEIDISNIEI
ncbi:restriction endonuclease subunit S [Treponema putidum]|uniref:restriction endonuclease subunit S n=2 Tax=Treponema putidum TaxID=221027 RepID=UPI00067904F9|nr:restriction endonuclease subunit S [Treponema putidum]TWI78195.1 type I restriction enzyme S subunit [Treponema putidum]